MEAIQIIGFFVGLNMFCSISSYAAPLVDIKNGWQSNVITPIVTTACSTNGRCWGWWPMQELHDDAFLSSDNFPESRSQFRREATDSDSDSWEDRDSTLQKPRPSQLSTRQFSNRISKKDTFMSRGLGAGGMPFSVLYMNPHGPRPNHAEVNQEQEQGRTVESSMAPLEHPNYRIALRNGGTNGPPRRQYSIIPQLFISYGWGPFGK